MQHPNPELSPYHRHRRDSTVMHGLPIQQNDMENVNHNGAAYVAGTPPPHAPSVEAQHNSMPGQPTAPDVTGFNANFGWYHGPYREAGMLVAPGASPICGYVTDTATGEQCGVVVTIQRTGVASLLRTHLEDVHSVLATVGREGGKEHGLGEKRGLQTECKVRLLDMYYAPGGQFNQTLFGESNYIKRRQEVQRLYLDDVPANFRPLTTTLPQRPANRTLSVAVTPISVSASIANEAQVDTPARAGTATPADNVHPVTSVPDRVDKVSTPVRATFSQLNASGGPGSNTRANSVISDRGSGTPTIFHPDNARKVVERKRKRIEKMKLQWQILQDEEELEVLQEASVVSPSGTFGLR
jgi:hypothetical protein